MIGVAFLDELTTGLPVSASPAVHDDVSKTHVGLTLIVFVAPTIVALVAEPPLLLLAGRLAANPRRRRFVLPAALAAMALTFLACAVAPSALAFGAAYALFGTAVGVAAGIAQTAAVEKSESAERAMARWALASTLGDLAAPILLYVFQRTFGWRAAIGAASVLIAAWALLSVGVDPGSASAADDEEAGDGEAPSLRAALRNGLRNRKLVAWVTAASLSSLMDETLVVFGALYVRERFKSAASWMSPEAAVTAVLVAFALGATVGLLALDRVLLRVKPRSLLVAICIATAGSFIAWLLAPTPVTSAIGLFVVGFFASAVYPLVKAQAYRAAPNQGALVNAVTQLFGPIDLIVPLGLGVLADAYGVRAALLVMLLQPVGVLVITWAAARDVPQE